MTLKVNSLEMLVRQVSVLVVSTASFLSLSCLPAKADSIKDPNAPTEQLCAKEILLDYFKRMSEPKPFVVREGSEFKAYQRKLRERILQCAGLSPLPERVPLDIHQSDSLDHPWCTVRRVYYQLWPGVYSNGLLYMPKKFQEKPAPAILCPHGHWKDGNAYPDVQKRCLVLAKKGYVVFSPAQNHHEDLVVGVSHQSLMIWNNMRALDYLETLPEVDKNRIGCTGCSGGGLQTQMLVALDGRVKAATIAGMTCDYRKILFPEESHCHCNHFPNIMQFTDQPEISTLGLPVPVQYLTMNDWTKDFQRDNFPKIQQLYAANGFANRVDCMYWPTEHLYDTPKRERTYWWMDRWLRGIDSSEIEKEPNDIQTFPPETLLALSAGLPEDKGFGQISILYRQQRGFKIPAISGRDDWQNYRCRMIEALRNLLGEGAKLSRNSNQPQHISTGFEQELVIERINYPSEGPIYIPTIVLHRKDSSNKLPVVIICDQAGKETLLKENGPDSPVYLAQAGSLVVLPDVRFTGEFAAHKLSERNAVVWGRPFPGMACTDIQAVLDGLASRKDADISRVKVITRGSAGLAVAAVFASVLDERINSLDVDFQNSCFEKRNLPVVPFVLEYGDILQWSALLADRESTIRNVPKEAGDANWLIGIFSVMGNAKGLRIEMQ